MAQYGLTQADVVRESALPGGQSSLSAWLNDRKVANLVKKQKILSDWVKNKRTMSAPDPTFFHNYRVNQSVDARDFEGAWYPAVVMDARPGVVLVHYKGWSSSYDEWISTTTDRLAPAGKHTSAKGIYRLLTTDFREH